MLCRWFAVGKAFLTVFLLDVLFFLLNFSRIFFLTLLITFIAIYLFHFVFYRDDGSGIALKVLKRVQKGWGQGSIFSLQPQKDDFLDY